MKTQKKKLRLKKGVRATMIILLAYMLIAIILLVAPTPKDKKVSKVDVWGNVKEVNR